MTTFLHSGGCGDIIYSLPLVKRMGGGIMYLKSSNSYNNAVDQYQALKRLLESQDYITEVRPYPVKAFFDYDPNIPIDVDLDRFRRSAELAKSHLIKSYFKSFNIDAWNWDHKWLTIDDNDFARPDKYVVVNKTVRYGRGVNWNKVINDLEEEYDHVLFIGLDEEYEMLGGGMDRAYCDDLMDAARFIYHADAIYCNQSACLTIAQGLGKKVYLETARAMTNCIIGNETIL